MVAFCGIDCTACSAYLATQADDTAEKEWVTARWRKDTGEEGIDADYVAYDGCLAFEGRLGDHCSNYPCANLDEVFYYAPEVRERLDKIHRSLQATGGEDGG